MTIGSNSEIKMYLNNYNVNNDTVYCKEEDSLKNSTLNLTCQHRLNKSRIICIKVFNKYDLFMNIFIN